MSKALLEASHVSISYGSLEAVSDASFTLYQGDFVALIGPNGSGKTTLIKALLGLVSVSHGTFSKPDSIRIGYLPQHTKAIMASFPAYVSEIIQTGFKTRGFNPPSLDDINHYETLVETLNIRPFLNQSISKLSGGQQQRALLARALLGKPDLLILDEPTSALDPKMRKDFFDLVRGLNQNGMTILMITHDVASAYDHVNRIIAMDRTIRFDGTCEAFCQESNMSPFMHRPHPEVSL